MSFSLKSLILTTLLALLPAAYRPEELDQILAPVALYPDPLLAQILPAASFGNQISEAQALLNGAIDENLIQAQNWDIGVKAIAHYRAILRMLAENPEWTASLGQAYVTQLPDVERSIQRLRARAEQAGMLQNTPEQQVITEQNYIQIEPAQPEVIYVPEYDPEILWEASPSSDGAAIFSPGFAIGPWLNRDWDWHGRGPYYHGWNGGGWIRDNRRFLDTHNNFYVNDKFRNIHVDRNVAGHSDAKLRTEPGRDRVARSKPGAALPAPAAPSTAPHVSPRPSMPGLGHAPMPTRPATSLPAPRQHAAPTAPPIAAPQAAPQHLTPPAAAPAPHPAATPPPPPVAAPHAVTPPPPAAPPMAAPHPAPPPPPPPPAPGRR